MAAHLASADAEKILEARAVSPFTSIEDLWRRTPMSRGALERLANADAFHSFGLSRRQALWQVRGLGEAPLPLFAAAGGGEAGREPGVALRPMTAGREVVEDYRHLQLSLRAHPLSFLRPELERRGIMGCRGLEGVKDGRKVEVAGLVLVRQKPGSAKVTFITIEDETGIANIIVWPALFETHRRIVMSATMIAVKGRVQREGEVIHVIADRLEDYSDLLREVGEMPFPHRPGPGAAATHGGGPDRGENVIRVKSRDFH